MHRAEIDAIKQTHPIADVVARYGIDLRPSGRALTGRCPFHSDGGRPNLYVYPATNSFYCFRCAVGGDIFSFIQRIEGVDFLTAVEGVHGQQSRGIASSPSVLVAASPARTRRSARPAWGAEERACLAAAAELYQNRLLSDGTALAYVQARGIDVTVIERCRLGYAEGNELAEYLRWRRLPARAAIRVGLLGRHGRETMAGRVVIPEIRNGQPIWMVGRVVDAHVEVPKYLGLPGRKPLLGWESARGSESVFVVEGPFDWLTLRSWDFPTLALVGTHVRPAVLDSLARFPRVYLVLDNDEAGRAATTALGAALGSRAVSVSLSDANDVGDLATRADGHDAFLRAVHNAQLSVTAPPVALAA